jgi:hypothetical protein
VLHRAGVLPGLLDRPGTRTPRPPLRERRSMQPRTRRARRRSISRSECVRRVPRCAIVCRGVLHGVPPTPKDGSCCPGRAASVNGSRTSAPTPVSACRSGGAQGEESWETSDAGSAGGGRELGEDVGRGEPRVDAGNVLAQVQVGRPGAASRRRRRWCAPGAPRRSEVSTVCLEIVPASCGRAIPVAGRPAPVFRRASGIRWMRCGRLAFGDLSGSVIEG